MPNVLSCCRSACLLYVVGCVSVETPSSSAHGALMPALMSCNTKSSSIRIEGRYAVVFRPLVDREALARTDAVSAVV